MKKDGKGKAQQLKDAFRQAREWAKREGTEEAWMVADYYKRARAASVMLQDLRRRLAGQ